SSLTLYLSLTFIYLLFISFFFNDTATTEIYTLSLHDALPICIRVNRAKKSGMVNITSSVNSRERSGINTILHELNPLFPINVTKIGRAVQQECRDRSRMPSSA